MQGGTLIDMIFRYLAFLLLTSCNVTAFNSGSVNTDQRMERELEVGSVKPEIEVKK